MIARSQAHSSAVDVLLVYPPTGWSPGAMSIAENDAPPIGLLYVAAAARRAGLQVTVVDMNHPRQQLDNLLDSIAALHPRIVGFSVLTPSAPTAGELIRGVRAAAPDVCIVVGGIHATVLPESLLAHGADFAVLGEGEDSFPELALAILNGSDGRDVPGLAYLRRSQESHSNSGTEFESIPFGTGRRRLRLDLDGLGWPARDLVPILDYGQAGAVCGSRGCSYACSFCSSVLTPAHRYRHRSVASVLEELDAMHGSLGIRRFQFFDDNFLGDPDHAASLVNALGTRQYVWSCQATVMEFAGHEDMLEKMYRSGCREVYFGLESGSDHILSSYKRITRDRALRVIRRAADWGCGGKGGADPLRIVVGFIVGHPDDDEGSVQDTVDLAVQLRSEGIDTMMSILQPYPGSLIHRAPERYGVRITGTDYSQYLYARANVATRHLQPEALTRLYAAGLLRIMETYGSEYHGR